MSPRAPAVRPRLIPRNRIRSMEIPRSPAKLVAQFLTLEDLAGLVSRALDRLGVAGAIPAHEIAPLAGSRIAGPAITVRNVPDRPVPHAKWQRGEASLMAEREAYFLARRGDVIVIDGGARMSASNMGGHSARAALDLGCAATIVDGPVTGSVRFDGWAIRFGRAEARRSPAIIAWRQSRSTAYLLRRRTGAARRPRRRRRPGHRDRRRGSRYRLGCGSSAPSRPALSPR